MIYSLGKYGVLSREFLVSRKIESTGGVDKIDFGQNTVVVMTYSPTQRQESVKAYKEEIRYYRNIIKYLEALNCKGTKVVYISSQTVIQNAKSLYGRAKINVEKQFRDSNLRVLILRPGFIFDSNGKLLNKGTKMLATLPITLQGCMQLYSACRTDDIISSIEAFEKGEMCKTERCEVVQVGVRLTSLKRILNYNTKHAYRLNIPRSIIKIASKFNGKLHKLAFTGAGVICSECGIASYYDRL